MTLQHIKAFVEGYCTPIPTLPDDPRIALLAAKDNIRAEDALTKINKKIEADIRVKIASEIQVFRCRECKGNPEFSNLQFASRSVTPTITNFLKTLLDTLTETAEGNIRYGMAPPTATERALRQLLQSMGE